MKKFMSVFIIMICILISGCSGGGSEVSNQSAAGANDTYSDGLETNGYEDEQKQGDSTAKSDDGEGTGETKDNTTNKINEDKLIYRCTLSIDTLDFDTSVKNFRDMIKKYEGFVETENETDGAQTYDYSVTDPSAKHYTYTATVRIPSGKYDDFLNETGNIGDIRQKDAHVDNVSQNYYDLSAELEVLKTKYDRYLEMLKKAKSTTEILQIENSITGVETQINQIKTRLNQYDNDVAYSYVNITIRQVKEYTKDQPDNSLLAAIRGSWSSFTGVMHDLLVLFIYMLPYLVVAAVILVIVLVTVKTLKKKKS